MNFPSLKFVDLFCGIGGFRVAIENVQATCECVFSCDFDLDSQKSYEANFGEKPFGDITKIHENKGGNISPLPYSCALRSGASYNYLLVNGERRLTEREMLRLQGFPEDYKIVVGYQAMRKLAGNSVAIPCVEAVLHSVLSALEKPIQSQTIKPKAAIQESLFAQI